MLNKHTCVWPLIPVLLSACTSSAPSVETAPEPVVIDTPTSPEVVHTARYTLVSLTPDEALRYPLRQITRPSLHVKPHTTLTRGDALHAWLEGSGYGLCLPVATDLKYMLSSPLPDVQRDMGPLRIERALQLIAGSAWMIMTDEVSRTVCFTRLPHTLR